MDRQYRANSFDPEAASDQGPHYLPLIKRYKTNNREPTDLFKSLDNYGNELSRPNKTDTMFTVYVVLQVHLMLSLLGKKKNNTRQHFQIFIF